LLLGSSHFATSKLLLSNVKDSLRGFAAVRNYDDKVELDSAANTAQRTRWTKPRRDYMGVESALQSG